MGEFTGQSSAFESGNESKPRSVEREQTYTVTVDNVERARSGIVVERLRLTCVKASDHHSTDWS